MPFGNVIDELHDEHGLAYTGTAEQTDLTALAVRLEEVDHLYTCIKYLGTDREVVKLRGRLMYGSEILAVESRQTVNGITYDIEQTAFHLLAGGDSYRTLEIVYAGSALQSVGTLHGHTAHGLLTDMLLHFKYQLGAVRAHYFESGVDGRDDNVIAVKHHVDHRSDHLDDFAIFFTHRDWFY